MTEANNTNTATPVAHPSRRQDERTTGDYVSKGPSRLEPVRPLATPAGCGESARRAVSRSLRSDVPARAQTRLAGNDPCLS
jgi:hypothetical protein